MSKDNYDDTKPEDNNYDISDNEEADDDDDEYRSHSFRERRLTYSRHHILSDTAAAAVAELLAEGDDFSDDDDDDRSNNNAAVDTNNNTNETIEVSAIEKAIESPSSPAAASTTNSSPQQQQHSNNNNNKRRRGSSFSINSDTSSKPSTTTSYYLPSRILHAGEIVRRYSSEHSSPVSSSGAHPHANFAINGNANSNNNNNTTNTTHEVRTGAYPHPTHFATSKTHHHSHHRNKWRQRFSFCSTTPDHILPFPRHVVGTFSCHGMEPVYDSDYDNSDSDDNVDDNSGEKNANTSIAKINQDRGGIIYPYANSTNMALFAVYDGHGEGGELVSQFALGEVSRILSGRLVEGLQSGRKMDGDGGGSRKRRRVLESVSEESSAAAIDGMESGQDKVRENDDEEEKVIIEQSLKDTFITVDRGLLDEEEIEPMYSGTTACVVLKRYQRLYISNCGDSRAVLARRNIKNDDDSNGQTNGGGGGDEQTSFTTIPLSIDQNPDSPGEKERILDSGGFVSPPPEPGLTARVWLDSNMTQIGLAMARSIGDHAVKGVGVIAEPVVSVHDIDEELDDFVIIATDGVWEFISSEEAVDIVGKYLHDTSGGSGGGDASEACEALIKAATAKWHEFEGDYRDDITAMVIRLKDLSCAA